MTTSKPDARMTWSTPTLTSLTVSLDTAFAGASAGDGETGSAR
jgi:hypothetical protein